MKERKWVAAVVLALCALAVAVGAANAPLAPEAGSASTQPQPQYPELDRADAKLVAAIADAWGADGAPQYASIVFSAFGDTSEKVRDRVVRLLDSHGAAAAPAFLAFLRDRFGPKGETSILVTATSPDDAKEAWAGTWLRVHASPETRTLLRRMAADRSIDENLRRQCVVALASPGDDASRETLVAIALDEGESDSIRDYTLRRMPRLGGEAPASLHVLLESPRPAIPVAAAASLATWGDCEAPSLLVDALRRAVATENDTSLILCAEALRHVIPAQAGLDERLAQAAKSGLSWSGGPKGEEKARAARTANRASLVTGLQAWFDAHPELRETEFERARRAYLEGPRHRDEMALTTLEAIIAAPEERLDIAAAILLTRLGPEKGDEHLERLNRLAKSIRREVGEGATPERWIEALNARLLSRHKMGQYPFEPSELSYVMSARWGNCVGFTSMYLAVADRLGLPIRAVAAPNHVFARWDDGTLRRNIECTDGGAAAENASYLQRSGGLGIREEDVASGQFLANLSRREFVSCALANRAELLSVNGRLRDARETADAAVLLDPRNANALVQRAVITAQCGGDRDAAVADLRAAQELRRLSPGEGLAAANVFLYAGLADDALRTADAALALVQNAADQMAVRARALVRLGRVDEARRLADEALARDADAEDVIVADVELRLLTDDPEWFDRLARTVDEPAAAPDAHFALARVLLAGPGGGPPEPGEVARILDAVRALDGDDAPIPRGGFWRCRTVHGNQRRYFDLRSRCCRALGDEAGAAAAEASLLKLDGK